MSATSCTICFLRFCGCVLVSRKSEYYNAAPTHKEQCYCHCEIQYIFRCNTWQHHRNIVVQEHELNSCNTEITRIAPCCAVTTRTWFMFDLCNTASMCAQIHACAPHRVYCKYIDTQSPRHHLGHSAVFRHETIVIDALQIALNVGNLRIFPTKALAFAVLQ